MIISVDEVMGLPAFRTQNRDTIQKKLDGLEAFIRKYTNNNFQVRQVRFWADTLGDRILSTSPYITVGDTVQITESPANNGLYVVTEMGEDFIRVNRSMYTVTGSNLVTKIHYPADIVQGVLKLLEWDIQNRGKIGIKSETLSRHSVTYYDQDRNNQSGGYPVSLLGFLDLYRKARF